MLQTLINKLAYLYLILNLKLIFIFSFVLRNLSFLITPKQKKHDLILFPFSQKGSIGYTLRFEEYFPFLEKDKVDFYICDIFDNEYILKQESGTKRQKYKLYRKIAWIRLKQVVKARNYKAAFIHRGLFPYYPDLEYPYFEILLRKLNKNITLDFWDSVWLYSGEKLINETVKYCDKLTVVNQFLANYFEFTNQSKIIFPIGVNTNKYSKKSSYELNNPIKFVYTGGPGNVKMFLDLISPILLELNLEHEFKIVIISRARIYIDNLEIEYHDFNEKTFFDVMHNCDIGLYMVKEDEESKGKMAMKVLDYMSSGLPSVATPCGLPPYTENEKNIIYATNHVEWINKLKKIITDHELRSNLGSNAYEMVEKHHSINKSYLHFKQLYNN